MVVRDTFVDVNDGDQLNDGYFNGGKDEIEARNFYDWYDDPADHTEWDPPDSSFDTALWDTTDLAQTSETATFQQITATASDGAPATDTNTLKTKTTIPANRKAYAMRFSFDFNIGGSASGTRGFLSQVHFAGTDYTVDSVSNQSMSENPQRAEDVFGSVLVKRTAVDTYDLFINGEGVATGISTSTTELGITVEARCPAQSNTPVAGTTGKIYYIRYTND